MGKVRELFGEGFENNLGKIRELFGRGLRMVWERFGLGLGTVGERFWERLENYLGKV